MFAKFYIARQLNRQLIADHGISDWIVYRSTRGHCHRSRYSTVTSGALFRGNTVCVIAALPSVIFKDDDVHPSSRFLKKDFPPGLATRTAPVYKTTRKGTNYPAFPVHGIRAIVWSICGVMDTVEQLRQKTRITLKRQSPQIFFSSLRRRWRPRYAG